MARGGLSSVMARVASLAVAEVASSADFAGVTSPADLVWIALPAITKTVSQANLTRMAFPIVAGVASPVDFTFPREFRGQNIVREFLFTHGLNYTGSFLHGRKISLAIRGHCPRNITGI